MDFVGIKLKQREYDVIALFIMLLSLVCYLLISIVNHQMFRTYAIDLGIVNNAVYSYSHFKLNYGCVFQQEHINVLARHFDWQLMFFAPLSYLLGSYTMLVVQALAAAFGGIGVYKFVGCCTKSPVIQLLSLVFFYCYFAVWHALSMDYHSSVVSAMVLPWFLYAFKIRKYKLSSFLMLFIISGGEAMAMWAFFISIALIFDYRSDNKSVRLLIGYAIFSLFYYFIVTLCIMPWLGGEHAFSDWQYSKWGNSMLQVVASAFAHPIEALRQLFVNTVGVPRGEYVKVEFWLTLMLSGAIILLVKPNYFIMMIPLVAAKMFTESPGCWSIAYHYNIGFAPIVAAGAFCVVGKIKNSAIAKIFACGAAMASIVSTFYTINNPQFYLAQNRVRFYTDDHYFRPDINVDIGHHMIENVDDTSAVCVTSCMLPHLAMREKVYSFPNIADARYVITKVHPLPPVEGSPADVDSLKKSKDWKILMHGGDLIMFERR